jgi:hypothetical protein
MKYLVLALGLLPAIVHAQATHREATPEERSALLPSGAEDKLKAIGVTLSRQAETSVIESSLIQEALDKGSLPASTIEAYIQHLTNQDMSRDDIELRINELSKEYFAELQLQNLEKFLPADKQQEFKTKFESLDKKDASHEELDKELSKLDAEISSSKITKDNEKKFEIFQKSLLAQFKGKTYKKTAPELDDTAYTPFSIMVPLDFSVKSLGKSEALCLTQPELTVSEQLEQLNLQVEELTKEPKIHQIWIAWGYNRSTHSKSDVKFDTAYGSFTVHDAVGKDKPKPFGISYFDPAKLSIPQYNLELGMMFNEKWGMDLNFNHMKYVFDRLKPYEITGDLDLIVAGANGRIPFETAKQNKDATWLRFEHTDGYNYISLGAIYNQNIMKTKNEKFSIDARLGAGPGLMVPRTDVRLYHSKEGYRYGINNKFHVAGGGVHGDARLKFTFWDSIFIQAVTRATYVKVKNALVDGAEGRLEHIQPITSFQVIGQVGYQYKFKNKKNNHNKKKKK